MRLNIRSIHFLYFFLYQVVVMYFIFSKDGGDFFSTEYVDYYDFFSYQIIPLIIFTSLVSCFSWRREFTTRNIISLIKLNKKFVTINTLKFLSNVFVSFAAFSLSYLIFVTTFFLGELNFGIILSGSFTIFALIFFTSSFSTTICLLFGGSYLGGFLGLLLPMALYLSSVPSISRVLFNSTINYFDGIYDFISLGVSGSLSFAGFYLLFFISAVVLSLPKYFSKEKLLKNI